MVAGTGWEVVAGTVVAGKGWGGGRFGDQAGK